MGRTKEHHLLICRLSCSEGTKHHIVEEHFTAIPNEMALHQNYPNPFHPITTIRFEISKVTNTNLKVINILGEEVETLVDEIKQPGKYKITYNASGLSSGVYIAVLQTNEARLVRRMQVLK